MNDAKRGVTIKMLRAFTDAWNRHDIDALMAFMTDDSLRRGPPFRMPIGATDVIGCSVSADYRSGHLRERADGARVEVNGCDLFTFRDGKIAVKNAFRKDRIWI